MCVQHRKIDRGGEVQRAPLRQPLLGAVPHVPVTRLAEAPRPSLKAPERPVSHEIATIRGGQGKQTKDILETKAALLTDPDLENVSPEIRALVGALRSNTGAKHLHKKRRK